MHTGEAGWWKQTKNERNTTRRKRDGKKRWIDMYKEEKQISAGF